MLRWLRCLFPGAGAQPRGKENEPTATWVATTPIPTIADASAVAVQGGNGPARLVPPPSAPAVQPAVDSPPLPGPDRVAPDRAAEATASSRGATGASSTAQPALQLDTLQRQTEVVEQASAHKPGTQERATCATVGTPPPPTPPPRINSIGTLPSPAPMAALTPIAASRPAASTPCAAATPSPQQPQPQEQLTPAPRPGPGRQPFKAMDSNTTPTPALAPAFSFCTAVDYAAITPVLVRGQGATPSVASSTSGAYATPCTAASTAAGPCATPSSTTGADGTPEAPAAQALTRGVPGTESHRRYLVDCGKVVGVNNTMRRYHEEKPLRPPAVVQSTPFQERVNRELRAEEQLQQTLQGRGRR